MSLSDDIARDMKEAMKAGDKERLSTVRLLVGAVRNKAIELRTDELADEEVQSVVATLIRQRQDSIEQYAKAGRDDLADKEAREIEVLKGYMPPQLSEDELREIVRSVAAETGATSMKEMGAVMKGVMARVKGRADGRTVNAMVKEVLGG